MYGDFQCFSPRDVLDEIWDLIESVSEGFPTYSFIEAYAQSLRVDCDLYFKPSDICFLFATHCLIVIIIYANLFSNPTMHNKVMGRTRTGFTEIYAQSLNANSDLDL